jgi:lysophospholipase L1-like esterase
MKRKLYMLSSMLVIGLIGAGVVLWQSKSSSQPLYIALGDSVAAGLGLGDVAVSDGCGRTESAYPNLLAQEKGYELINLACSGATTTEGINGEQKTKSATVPSQISQISQYRKPELITMTIGANDIDWTGPIVDCFIAVCGTEKDTTKVTNKLTELEKNLDTSLNSISEIYNKAPPKVIFTTYYSFTSSTQTTCAQFTGVTDAEGRWLAEQATRLNEAIKNTVKKYSYATYVDVTFENNGLCDQTSWLQGVRDPAPFHPTLTGQQAIKDAILPTL